MSETLYRKTATTEWTQNWSPKTWNGLTSFTKGYIWTDGTDTYYSGGNVQCKLNKATDTWEPVIWNGLTSFYGVYIWTDGTDVYYSKDTNQYKLDKATRTWEPKSWSGYPPSDFDGRYIWTDGTNIYYSNGGNQYWLDTANGNTWYAKTWNGLTSFSGLNIWTDGTDTYCSSGTSHYVLNKATSTWSTKTWSGITNWYGNDVWTDGINVYYSSSYSHYIFDKIADTWSRIGWSGLFIRFDGRNVWTDGANIYYSNDTSSDTAQYVLDKKVTYEPVTIPESMKVKDRGGIWYPVKGVSVRTHGGSGPAEIKLDTKVPCLTANGDVVIMYDADGNILAHKSDIGNVAAVTRFAMYEIRNIYTGETCPFDINDVTAEQVSSIYVDGDGYLAYNDADDTEGAYPRQMLEWNSLNEAMIDFASIAGYPRYS